MNQKTQPRVVVIGGGTGMPVLLRGLKDFPIDLSAIVTVADDGEAQAVYVQRWRFPPLGIFAM